MVDHSFNGHNIVGAVGGVQGQGSRIMSSGRWSLRFKVCVLRSLVCDRRSAIRERKEPKSESGEEVGLFSLAQRQRQLKDGGE
jgi:hypothetical protein